MENYIERKDWQNICSHDSRKMKNIKERNENFITYFSEGMINSPINDCFFFLNEIDYFSSQLCCSGKSKIVKEISSESRIVSLLRESKWPISNR